MVICSYIKMPGMSSFQGPVPSILHGHTCKICVSLEITVMVTMVILQQLTLVIGSAFKVGLLLLPYASSFTEVCVVWAYQLKIDTISSRKYIFPFCTLFGATVGSGHLLEYSISLVHMLPWFLAMLTLEVNDHDYCSE